MSSAASRLAPINGIVIAIIVTTWPSFCKTVINDVISSENLPIMLV